MIWSVSAGDPPVNAPNGDNSFGAALGDASLNVPCCDNPESVGDTSMYVSSSTNTEGAVGDALNVPNNDSSERAADVSGNMLTCNSSGGFAGKENPRKENITWSDDMTQYIILQYDECYAGNPTENIFQRLFFQSHTTMPPSSSCYLNLAMQQLIKANENAKGRQTVYLIELARMHLSHDDIDTALGYFENAERTLCSTFGNTKHKNIAYLYEQWALLLLHKFEEHSSLQTKMDNLEDQISSVKEDFIKIEEQLQNIYPGNQVMQIPIKAFYLNKSLQQLAMIDSMFPKFLLKMLEDKMQNHERVILETKHSIQENQQQIEKYKHQMQSNREQNDSSPQQSIINEIAKLESEQKQLKDFQNELTAAHISLKDRTKCAQTLTDDIQSKYEYTLKRLENIIRELKDMNLIKRESCNSCYIDPGIEVQKTPGGEQLGDMLKQLDDFISAFEMCTKDIDQLKMLEQFVEMNEVTTSEGSDADDVEAQGKKLSRIECYFLKSIRSAVKVKSKPRLAYHKLAKMLEKALQDDPSSPKWMVLCEIYQLVGENKKAQSLLENRDMTTSKARQLLKQQCIQDEEYGKYLDLAHVIHNSKPDGSLRHDIVEMTLRKIKLSPGQTPKVDVNEQFRAYGEAMKIFMNAETEHLPSKAQCHRRSNGDDTNVLVFMARCEDAGTGGFSYIAESLKQCGIQVRRYLKRSLDDFEMGCNTRVEIMKTIEHCHLILASDFTDNRKMGDSLPPVSFIVEEASQCEHRIPILILQETGDPVPEEWKALPRVDVRDVNTDAKFHDFITKVFQNICPRKCPHCKNTLHRLTETPVV